MSDISASGGFPEFLRDMHAKFGPIFSFWYGKQYSVSIASHSLFKEQAHLFDRPRECEPVNSVYATIYIRNGTGKP